MISIISFIAVLFVMLVVNKIYYKQPICFVFLTWFACVIYYILYILLWTLTR